MAAVSAQKPDSPSQSRSAARASLGSYGPRAKPAVSRMTDLLFETHPYSMSRWWVLDAITKIDPEAAKTLQKRIRIVP
jgi:hypothetical protein